MKYNILCCFYFSKMNTKLAVSRMQLKRNKLFESIRQQRSTIESLLVEGQIRIARAKVDFLIIFVLYFLLSFFRQLDWLRMNV